MINLIVVHCSATKPSMDVGAEEIKQWHTLPKPKGKGWRDIGYHYIIKRDGTIEKGREDNVSGAHVRGHNTGSLGVCLVGGIDNSGKPDSNFTRSQYAALERLLTDLSEAYGNPRITGHRMLDSGKPCPSFDIESWWNNR
jgi:N-acetylmuramoyl-L-alanine amidase